MADSLTVGSDPEHKSSFFLRLTPCTHVDVTFEYNLNKVHIYRLWDGPVIYDAGLNPTSQNGIETIKYGLSTVGIC